MLPNTKERSDTTFLQRKQNFMNIQLTSKSFNSICYNCEAKHCNALRGILDCFLEAQIFTFLDASK